VLNDQTLDQTPDQALENPLMLALDVDSAEAALALVEKLHGKLGAIKVGPRLCVRYGAELIGRLAKSAPVFVDNKYLDIPNTMEAAVRATFDAGASFTTVHAWSGAEALKRLASVEAELNKKRPFKILTVTILTSFSQDALPPGLVSEPIENHVLKLAGLALASKLTGLVCSVHELAALRKLSPTAFLVAPGIRLSAGGDADSGSDQKRVETPEAAMRIGASAIVVGRPIYAAADPLAATNLVLESLAAGQKIGVRK
jgi:orotidine-5'-phosphate decarboxylase